MRSTVITMLYTSLAISPPIVKIALCMDIVIITNYTHTTKEWPPASTTIGTS